MSLKVMVKAGNRSVTMERLDSGMVEAAVEAKIQAMLQKYAPMITERARQILRSELRHPEKSTGRLNNSIRYKIIGHTITVYAGAPYALWVERDTRPHIIVPRNAKMLHWTSTKMIGAEFLMQAGLGGLLRALGAKIQLEHFALRVHHPGTKGKRMLQRAMDEYRETIKIEMSKMVSESIGEAAGR